MQPKYNKKLVPLAKHLRKEMTREERKLWYDFLRNYPMKFVRQKVLGRYIADFYSAEANLVIELDGGQHYTESGRDRDARRTVYLEEYGVYVLRISNREINRNFPAVCEYIDAVCKQAQV